MEVPRFAAASSGETRRSPRSRGPAVAARSRKRPAQKLQAHGSHLAPVECDHRIIEKVRACRLLIHIVNDFLANSTCTPTRPSQYLQDHLVGNAPEEWIPLRSLAEYSNHGITLRLWVSVTQIESTMRRVHLHDGSTVSYDALLLATGATPVHLPPRLDPLERVPYLRTLADSRALNGRAVRSWRIAANAHSTQSSVTQLARSDWTRPGHVSGAALKRSISHDRN